MSRFLGSITHDPSHKSPKGEPEWVYAGTVKSINADDSVRRTSGTRTLPSFESALATASKMTGVQCYARMVSDGRLWEVTDESPAQTTIQEKSPAKVK